MPATGIGSCPLPRKRQKTNLSSHAQPEHSQNLSTKPNAETAQPTCCSTGLNSLSWMLSDKTLSGPQGTPCCTHSGLPTDRAHEHSHQDTVGAPIIANIMVSYSWFIFGSRYFKYTPIFQAFIFSAPTRKPQKQLRLEAALHEPHDLVVEDCLPLWLRAVARGFGLWVLKIRALRY